MNYYYDIVLNFQEKNYMFYEWEEEDSIDIIKKIPIFQVNIKTFKDLINNEIKVDLEFLKSIENKTELKNKTLKYVALFASKNGSIALEFNNEGKSIYRSFLQVDDELGAIEMLFTLPVYKLNYTILKKISISKNLRKEDNIKNFIKKEIDLLYNKKEIDKLKYLYNEWFLKDNDDILKIYNEMNKKLQDKLSDREITIYNLIRLSYNNV